MRKAFFCGIGFLFVINCVYPQRPDLRFLDPLRAFELPDNIVTCITEDTTGFIWIGTKSGLSRFDGYNLRTYRNTVGDTSSLVDNEITRLFNTSKGDLWIGTRRGLCIYDQEFDRFEWLIQETKLSGVSSTDISDIGEDHEGHIYIATSVSLNIYNHESKSFSEIFETRSGEIKSFLFDGEDNIWIGTDKGGGLIYLDHKTGKDTTFFHDENNNNSISSNNPLDIALQGNKLWIATYDGGINLYDTETKLFKKYPAVNRYDLSCRSVYIDRSGKVWVISMTGLKVYDAEKDNFSGYNTFPEDPFGVKRDCNGIFQDSYGNFWTSHDGSGVGLSIARKGFVTYSTNTDRFGSPMENQVSAICEDEFGNTWIGKQTKGIDVFKWSEKKIVNYRYNPADRYSLGEGSAFCIFRDSKNIMWIGTSLGGLQYYDSQKNRFITYTNRPGDDKSIANNDIRSISEDTNGDLWVVVYGKGIDRFVRTEGIFEHYNSQNNGLSSDYAFQVLSDSQGNVWVGTVSGLCLLPKGENRFRTYYQSEKDANSLIDNNILSLYEDDEHNIWVGTTNGLNRYNRQKDNFDRFSSGFASTIINSVLSDKNGSMWLGTSRGLTMFNPKTGEYKNFNRFDGLISTGIYPRAGYRNSSKNMYFGGDNGFNIVNPDKLNLNTKPPKVLISRLDLFNKEIDKYSEKGPLQKNIITSESIKLKYEFNVITFRFIALDYQIPSRTIYAYKLEGFDKDWIESGNKREVTYTNLNPKRYVFKVRAANSDGYWNETGDSLELIVMPPWYGTVLFRIFLILFSLALIGAIVYIRTNRLRQQKIILEEQVRERTHELTGKNELLQKQAVELNDANEELKQANFTKNRLFSILAHDIINPFNTLLGLTDVLREDYDKISNDEKKEIINMVHTSSDRIHELLENLLKWTKSQTGKITVIKRVFRLRPTVDIALSLFEHTAFQKNISLETCVPEDVQVYADEDMISTILRNLLNNAIKFTAPGGKITVFTEQTEDKVTVYISDTGTGIAPEDIDSLFKTISKEVKTGTMGERGSGLGLIICKEFADINGGSMSVRSEPGKGSTFGVTLPANDRS